MKTLIVTSCTGEKKFQPLNLLTQEDFSDKERLKVREKELSEFSCLSKEMYTGTQHLRLMEGINLLRESFGNDFIDLYILSAGYGLISENKRIVPYEVTFSSMNSKKINKWSQYLNIHNDFEDLISKYDLIIFLVGDKYLQAVDLPFIKANENQKFIFFTSEVGKKMIPTTSPYFSTKAGLEESKSFSYGLVGLKGFLFKLMAQYTVDEDSNFFEKIYKNPNYMLDVLNMYRKSKFQESSK